MNPPLEYINLENIITTITRSSSIHSILTDIVKIARLKYGMNSSYRSILVSGEDDKKAAEKKIISYFRSKDYITLPGGTVDFCGIKDIDNKYPLAYCEFNIENESIRAYVVGDYDECVEIKKWFQNSFSQMGTKIAIASDIGIKNIISYNYTYMRSDSASVAHQSFYPWLSVSLEDYFKAYMESNESVLVMFGPPGTGKSTFLRSLMVSGNYRTTLAYNKSVVESSILINDFYSRNSRILAYEDIDNYLKSREDGNLLMSTILNATEGVIKRKDKKIVFSTNLPTIDRIDPALLRKGRCFDILEFRELTPLEAQVVALDCEIAPKDWESQKTWTLGQILSKESPAQQTVNRFAKKVGFF